MYVFSLHSISQVLVWEMLRCVQMMFINNREDRESHIELTKTASEIIS
jgi:hypothetical protein